MIEIYQFIAGLMVDKSENFMCNEGLKLRGVVLLV